MDMLARLVGAGMVALVVSAVAGPLYAHDSGLGIVRYNQDGSLDATFGHAGVVAERTAQGGLSPEGLVIQTDGKAVLGGTASDLATGAVGFGLARYTAEGSLDSAFGSGGRVLTRVGAATAEAHAIALQPDGTIVLAGSGYGPDATAVSNFAVARYAPDGTLDRAFGHGSGAVLTPIDTSGAEARAIALQADGRIVVAGTAFASGALNDRLALARYNADGSLDASFGSAGTLITPFEAAGAAPGSTPFRLAAVAIQTDGKLLAVGAIGGHQGAFALGRYLSDGSLDPTFGAGGKVITQREASAQAYAAAVRGDGTIVVGGGLGAAKSVAFSLARYRPNGDLDSSFGSGGFVATAFAGGGSGAHALGVTSDGSIVAAGSGYASAAPSPQTTSGQGAASGGFALVRYLADGAADADFGTAGVVLTTIGDAGSMPAALALQADGKLVVAGLTYFLVPVAADDRLHFILLLVPAAAGAVLVSVAIVLRQRRKRAVRQA